MHVLDENKIVGDRVKQGQYLRKAHANKADEVEDNDSLQLEGSKSNHDSHEHDSSEKTIEVKDNHERNIPEPKTNHKSNEVKDIREPNLNHHDGRKTEKNIPYRSLHDTSKEDSEEWKRMKEKTFEDKFKDECDGFKREINLEYDGKDLQDINKLLEEGYRTNLKRYNGNPGKVNSNKYVIYSQCKRSVILLIQKFC